MTTIDNMQKNALTVLVYAVLALVDNNNNDDNDANHLRPRSNAS